MKTVYMVVSGDLRLSANQACEKEQAAMEKKVVAAIRREGYSVKRAHGYSAEKKHGFIDSQKMGIEVFRGIPPGAPLLVAESVWQYSHHVLAGLITHKGPILTLANWSGTWPGLVGMLNLNGSLTAAGVAYSTLWSENFDDAFFLKHLRSWLKTGVIKHRTPQVRSFDPRKIPSSARKTGEVFARRFRDNKAILGVFDEGCMGMFNAIIPDRLLMPLGVFKERLSQSALYAKMRTVSNRDAGAVFKWIEKSGLRFNFGRDAGTELTRDQVLTQCKMYVAAVRMADEFGCSAIGIQYQQGLKDICPASDLVEGLLNCTKRPPVFHEKTGVELFAGQALPHFNEVDECAGLDGLVTYHLWRKLGFVGDNTLHDLRWGRHFKGGGIDAYVWVFLISGAAPASHFIGGYKGASSERQPPVYFPLGGGTLKGISKPGWIVWSRVYIENHQLNCDLGLAEVVKLPRAETEERWRLSTPQWPIMHAVLQGVTRDQMMARHKANHIQVVYAPSRAGARKGLYAKASAMKELGLRVFLCGDTN